jgi:cytochrome b561
MTTSHARVRTDNATRYVADLSRDWIESASSLVWDETHVAIAGRFGHCEVQAGGGFLDITLTTDSVLDTTLLEDILSEHLSRLADGERLRYEWILLDAPQ